MSKSYQHGWIVKKKRIGWTAFKMCWNVKTTEGTWKQTSETMDRYMPDGKVTVRKDAQKRLDEICAGINARQTVIEVGPKGKQTFSQYVTGEWKTYSDEHPLCESTTNTYRTMINKWMLPFFGDLQMKAIETETVTAFMVSLRTAKLAGKYRRNIYALMVDMFDRARIFKLIPFSPVEPKVHMPSTSRTEKPKMNVSDTAPLLAAIESNSGRRMMLLMSILVYTGMRQGEVFGLRNESVDLADGLVHKTHALYRNRLKEGVKNNKRGEDRVVKHTENELSVNLRAVLTEALELNPFKEPTAFLFSREDGSPLNTDDVRAKVLYPAMDAIGMKRGVRTHGFHIFRHTAASATYKGTGKDVKAVQNQLGHSHSSSVALDTYIHIDRDERLAAAEALSAAYPGMDSLLVTRN